MEQAPLPTTVSEEIKTKTAGVQSQRMVWQRAATRALGQGCSVADLMVLVRGFSAARSLDVLATLAQRSGERPADFLRSLEVRVDDSSYALMDWLAAVERVLLYLEKEGRSSKPSVVAGYVTCCAEFAGATEQEARLDQIVEEMLQEHGFEG